MANIPRIRLQFVPLLKGKNRLQPIKTILYKYFIAIEASS